MASSSACRVAYKEPAKARVRLKSTEDDHDGREPYIAKFVRTVTRSGDDDPVADKNASYGDFVRVESFFCLVELRMWL